MKRSTPLKRLTSLHRSRIKRKGRTAADTLRVYGPPERIDWMHARPCVVSGVCSNIVIAHVKTGGVSRKADAACWTVPMIPRLHAELHRIGIRSFEAKYNIDLELAATACDQAWQAHLARTA